MCFSFNLSTQANFSITFFPKKSFNEVGYMAIGFGTSMIDSEMYIVYYDPDPKLIERIGVGHTQPIQTNVQLATLDITQSDRKSITISRQLNPNNTQKDRKSFKYDDNIDFIWAYSSSKPTSSPEKEAVTIGIHEEKGAFTYNLNTGVLLKPHKSSNAPIIHGAMMIIAWLIMPAISIFVARYMKHTLGVYWFRIHYCLFIMTGLVSVISIVIMFVFIGSDMQNPHSIVGIFITVVYLFQLCLGVYIDRRYNPDRKHIPWYDMLHWWLGRFIFLFAIGNIAYGILIIHTHSMLWYSLIGLIIASTIGIYTVFEHRKNRFVY